jgi:uncharacterized ion transporter superfamily protein YfcC
VVVPGSYGHVDARPVAPFRAFVAIPRGMVDAASVIFLVFLVGGAFAVVDETGAFRSGSEWLARRVGRRPVLVVPVVSLAAATGGALIGMWEEFIALTPVMLIVARRVGFDAITAVAMSIGAAGIGSTFSPLNPFSVGIAQKLAGLPLLSAAGYRLVVMAPMLALWIWWTMRHATRCRTDVDAEAAPDEGAMPARHAFTLGSIVVAFGVYVVGTLRFGWGFEELSALFLLMGIAAGLLGGLRVGGTSAAFARGFKAIAYGAVLIGVARAIFVVMSDGRIVDTIIDAMVTPLSGLSATVYAVGMMVVQSVITLAVPSSSGRAVLTMPILVPLSELLGVSRQIAVLAYQFGPGIVGQIVPTDGALMAVLALAGVSYTQWLRFALPICAALFALSGVALIVAVVVGVQ